MEPNELPRPRSPIWEATVGPVWDRTLGPVVSGIFDFGAGIFDPRSGFRSTFDDLNRRFADLVENPAPLPGSGAARYLFPLGLLVVALVVGRKVLTKKK